MKDRRTLEELCEEIEDQRRWVDIRPYSHNIISLCLRQIAEIYGPNEANNTIIKLKLEALGWHEEKPNKTK